MFPLAEALERAVRADAPLFREREGSDRGQYRRADRGESLFQVEKTTGMPPTSFADFSRRAAPAWAVDGAR